MKDCVKVSPSVPDVPATEQKICEVFTPFVKPAPPTVYKLELWNMIARNG
jgi:hypothetical protein